MSTQHVEIGQITCVGSSTSCSVRRTSGPASAPRPGTAFRWRGRIDLVDLTAFVLYACLTGVGTAVEALKEFRDVR
jgi:hypothetical protein